MFQGVLNTIKRFDMLNDGDSIVVGVSGGPDSMALLHFLYTLKEQYSLNLHCAHLNHMLRGEESEGDTRYVEDFCEKIGISCTVRYIDIEELSKQEKISHEEAGRKARYSLFKEIAESAGANKIALAHNMNDQAETVLMRLMRGTGLDGLCGIKPVREGMYIRPLLYTSRRDIEEYCRENSLNPRLDSTNLEAIYARNKVRLELIPYIKENYNSSIEYSLSSMADILSEDNDFISGAAEKTYEKAVCREDKRVSVDIEFIKNEHNSIIKRVLRKAVETVKGDLNSIESKHISLLVDILMSGTTGSAVELPGRLRAEVSYGSLKIYVPGVSSQGIKIKELNIPGSTFIDDMDSFVEAEILLPQEGYFSEDRFVKYFDYDKIKGSLAVRSRMEGDYIIPLGMKGKKRIKELFIDNKVPKDERDNVPLIAIGKEIVWVIGYNISNSYKITKDTKKVLSLKYKQLRGNKNAK